MANCTACGEDRLKLNLSVRQLKSIPRPTQNRKLIVHLCEHCDGPAYKLAKRKDNIWFDPDEQLFD